MLQLGCVPLAKVQHGLTVPVEPNRPWLRTVMRVDRREPNDLLLAEASVDPTPESGCEVNHQFPSSLLRSALIVLQVRRRSADEGYGVLSPSPQGNDRVKAGDELGVVLAHVERVLSWVTLACLSNGSHEAPPVVEHRDLELATPRCVRDRLDFDDLPA